MRKVRGALAPVPVYDVPKPASLSSAARYEINDLRAVEHQRDVHNRRVQRLSNYYALIVAAEPQLKDRHWVICKRDGTVLLSGSGMPPQEAGQLESAFILYVAPAWLQHVLSQLP